VEAAVIQENEWKYHQTEGGSQLLDDVFRVNFGSFGEGPEIDAVLNGTYELPAHVSQATQDFLAACKRPDQPAPTPCEPTISCFKDYVHSWKCRKEKTTSAHQHLGHYKVVWIIRGSVGFYFKGPKFIQSLGTPLHDTGNAWTWDLMIMKKHFPLLSRNSEHWVYLTPDLTI